MASLKVIGTKWAFAIKRNDKGIIERFKARLVALGYRQTPGVDYFETYAPVANMNTIRVFLVLCCQRGYVVMQYDIDTAFLNGCLKEDVYIWPPKGIQIADRFILKLNRALYGLKQAAITWYKTITRVFEDKLGFKRCKTDSCIFVRNENGIVTYIVLYVDDLLIGAPNVKIVEDIIAQLQEEFKLKTLGQVKFILGMEVDYDRSNRTMKLFQAACITRMVEKFNQVDCKPVYNPSVQGQVFVKSEIPDPRMKNRPFRSLIGSLLYVANGTRPDITFAVCQLSRHLENPTEEHWKAAIRILRYLKTTKTYGIKYKSSKSLQLSAYSDADWASSKENRRSTSGIFVMINGSPVIFKSRLQRVVALSTAEAEYIALSLCVQEVMWTKTLLSELVYTQDQATIIYEDNQSAIAIAKNDGYQSRAKHIDIRHHFVREQVKFGNIDLQYISSKSQLADYLTKPLATMQFQELLNKSNVGDYKSRGSVEG